MTNIQTPDLDRLPRTIAEFNAFNVNRPGWEKIRQSFYDRLTYLAAGQSVLQFFQQPAGQGGKTKSDTNMTLAGQLPKNQVFLVQGIEIFFFPTTPSVAADLPAAFGAGQAADSINDVYVFHRFGNLELFIGSKSYLQEAPLGKFPSSRNFHIEAALADATTAAANLQSRIAYASSVGRPYALTPPVLLIENQNFSLSLNWPEGLQALPSGNPAVVHASLEGIQVRRSQ